MLQQGIIDTDEALRSLTADAKQRDAVALDTEFLWERTYYPRLGLIQLALSNDESYLIDPLAINDFQPLGDLLADANVVKIFHDAPQDLAILARATGSIPRNIFDTRLAAGFSGLSSTLSLANLIDQLLDIQIDKSATRSNWLQRPLSEKQLHYAADDVRYLRAIRVLLLARISTPAVGQWLTEELAVFNDPKSYDFFNPTQRYKKIKGFNQLAPRELSLLKKLSLWREEQAQKKDRPRGHILQDKFLLEIARKRPVTFGRLEQTGISPKAIKRYGNQLISMAKQREPIEKTRHSPINKPHHKLTKSERDTLTSLSKTIHRKSDALGIDPALIANTAELKMIVRSMETGTPLFSNRHSSGWRKEFIESILNQ